MSETQASIDLSNTGTVVQIGDENMVNEIHRVFNLGKYDNVSRGAPSGLSTAYGSLSPSLEQWKRALAAEEASKKAQVERELGREVRESADIREKPLVDALVQKGFMTSKERLTKRSCLQFWI